MSIMEMSHRGKQFMAVNTEAQLLLCELLSIPNDYAVLFVQGGASQQFAAVPLNLMKSGKADYILTGNFATKAYEEAQKYSAVLMDADSTEEQPPKQTKKKKISLSTFVTSAIAIVLVTVMMTWSFCTSLYRQALAEIAQNGIVMDAPSDKLGLINAILETYSYYDLDEEEMLEAVVEAYKATTGDRYATYMNKA